MISKAGYLLLGLPLFWLLRGRKADPAVMRWLPDVLRFLDKHDLGCHAPWLLAWIHIASGGDPSHVVKLRRGLLGLAPGQIAFLGLSNPDPLDPDQAILMGKMLLDRVGFWSLVPPCVATPGMVIHTDRAPLVAALEQIGGRGWAQDMIKWHRVYNAAFGESRI